jgi:hypothetical protein
LAIPLVMLKGGWVIFGISATVIFFWFIMLSIMKKKNAQQ